MAKAKKKLVFFCKECGFESPNGLASVQDAMNGIHLLKRQQQEM